MSSITTWAQHVQPGSPSSPSPRKHRRPSISRLHLNLAPSRPGLPKHARARSGSASFLHILDTPSTSSASVVVLTPSPTRPAPTSANGSGHAMNNIPTTPKTPRSSPLHAPNHVHPTADFDLTALGYTSLFLRLPTPATPHYPTNNSNPSNDSAQAPNADDTPDDSRNVQQKGNIKAAFARLRARSFSALLRPRKPSSSNTPSSPRVEMDVPPVPAIPAKYLTSSSTATTTTSLSPSTNPPTPKGVKTKEVKKEKEVKKAKKAKKHPLPPTLASELALMQFLDGGSLEDNIAALSHSTLKNSTKSSTTTTTTTHSTYSSHPIASKGASNKGMRDVGRDIGNGVYGVGGEWVYTDAAGRVWRDADEALEYAHLLAPSPTSPTPPRSPYSPPYSPTYSYVLNTPKTPYSPAFSIVSISFPSPSPSLSPSFSPSLSPKTGGFFPSTPRSFEGKERMEVGTWITFTAYSPSSPSFPPPPTSLSSSNSPFNSSPFSSNSSFNKFTRRRKSSVAKDFVVKKDSLHKTTMRRELATRRRGSLVRRVPRTPPCGALPPTPYSSTPTLHSSTPYSDIDTDVEMGGEMDGDGNGKRERGKRMGMAGLGFWAI